MTLPILYAFLHVLTIVLFFVKPYLVDKYKISFIRAHVILLLIVLLDIFIINFKGVLLDRLLVVAFLLTASMTFALYRRTLLIWQKLYFGFFLFYPIIAAVTFLIDRIMFVLVASPLLVTLTMPETKFSSSDYEIREIVGAIAPVQLALVKKNFITEKHLGVSNDERITYNDITGLKIIHSSGDTTLATVTTGDKNYEIYFLK